MIPLFTHMLENQREVFVGQFPVILLSTDVKEDLFRDMGTTRNINQLKALNKCSISNLSSLMCSLEKTKIG